MGKWIVACQLDFLESGYVLAESYRDSGLAQRMSCDVKGMAHFSTHSHQMSNEADARI